MSTTQVTCAHCGTSFSKRTAEVNRSVKLGRKHYCNRSCMGKDQLDHMPLVKRANAQHLRGHESNRKDEYSPFRWHFRNAIRRSQESDRKECTITLDDLKKQWDDQKGKCPYTGWELKNLPDTNTKKQLPLTPDRASLDRKDSSKGYVPGNIQFVSTMANYAKNRWGDQELFEFCAAVYKGHVSGKM